MPFIAITEAVFTRIVAEQYDTLQRAVDAEHVLTRAVMDGSGTEGIARSLADVTKGWALLLDLHGLPIASTGRAATVRAGRVWEELRTRRPEGTSFSVTLVDRGHHIWVQPVGAQGRVEAFLAVGKPEQPSQLDRIVAGHALSLFAIELAKSRAVADARHRLQGDFFDELARGDLTATEAAKGLARFGFDRDAPVMVLSFEATDASIDPVALADAATDDRSRAGGGFLASAHDDGVHLLVPAEPAPDLAEVSASIGGRLGTELRTGAGSPVGAAEVGRSLREARYALQVCRLEGWAQAGFADLGTYRLLLSMADPDALRAFSDSMLAPARHLRPRARRRAARLAAGVPAAQRPLGDCRRRAVRAPPHAALPHAQGGGAHRARPHEQLRPHGVLARVARPRSAGCRRRVKRRPLRCPSRPTPHRPGAVPSGGPMLTARGILTV